MKILYALLFLYLVTIEPYLEAYYFRRFENNQSDPDARVALYKTAFLRNWLICFYVLAVAYFCSIPMSEMGFRSIHSLGLLNDSPVSLTLMLGCCIAYFIYFYMYVFLPLINDHLKDWVAKKLIPVVCIAPASAQEKRWWMCSSLTAAAEEVFYRGFIFFFISALFPTISVWYVIIISVLVDAIRYYHRPIAIFYVAYSALAFASLYAITGSIYVPMIAHIIHDLRALLMPLKRAREKFAEGIA